MNAGLAASLMRVEGLPSLACLHTIARQGIRTLINVSGSPMGAIHGEAVTGGYRLSEFGFSDLFSQRPVADRAQTVGSLEFTLAFSSAQREQFRQAVQACTQALARHESILVFCHHGVGRSPAVALAVARCAWGLDAPAAVALVRRLRPQAHLSTLSLSAADWAVARQV